MTTNNLPSNQKSIKTCAVAECSGRHRSKGFCQKHYTRNCKYGSPHITHKEFGLPIERRFWKKVEICADTEKCWDWAGRLNPNGYAQIRINKKSVYVHRLAYLLTRKQLPDLEIMHSCDNRKCCNPRHLTAGTHQENMAQQKARNRQAKGEAHGGAKLTIADVQCIRNLAEQKTPLKSIAEKFAVSASNISHIVKRKLWK